MKKGKQIRARYCHTNLVARDWRRLASFYEKVFGCEAVPPQRDLHEEWLARGSGVADARLQGIHLRLPGCGEGGPTLEIFQYRQTAPAQLSVANRAGYGHLAFEVDDVAQALRAVVAAGGRELGEIVTAQIAGAGTITWTYVRDPEGNIIELQHWS